MNEQEIGLKRISPYSQGQAMNCKGLFEESSNDKIMAKLNEIERKLDLLKVNNENT